MIFKLLILTVLIQSVLSVPTAYILDDTTTFCFNPLLTKFSARLFRKGTGIFMAVLDGNDPMELTGIVYDPKDQNERTVRIEFNEEASTVTYKDYGTTQVFHIRTTSNNYRELCLWTDLASAVGTLDLDGRWAEVGTTDPVVNYCLGPSIQPSSSYYFIYPDGSSEIGTLKGKYGLEYTIFFGNWTSEYVNCHSRHDTNYAIFVVEPGDRELKHIGYSTEFLTPTTFEEYVSVGNYHDCTVGHLMNDHCQPDTADFVPTDDFSAEAEPWGVYVALLVTVLGTVALLIYAFFIRPKLVSTL